MVLDFSIEANRRKFISAGGRAVWLGDRAPPAGKSPDVLIDIDHRPSPRPEAE